jgi:lambda family phage portal protein
MTLTAREISAGLGVPFESLTGDLSSVNYSSIRAGLVEFRRRCEAIQHGTIAFQLLRPIWRRWLLTEILSGRINAPGFDRDPEAYLAVKWITPKQQWVDPAKDVQAETSAIAAGLMSRREAIASRGYDIEQVDAEIAADNARAKSLGLDFTAKPNTKEPAP